MTVLASGAISFVYVSDDVAPPVNILNEYKETGVTPYPGTNGSAPVPGVWPGPGSIISPSLKNPEMEISNNVAISESSFWDNNRVGYSWTTDGDSWNRINCGNGISVKELSLGDETGFDDAGPAVDPSTGVVMQCPPSTKQWQEYASRPEGWERYCPEESFSDFETYNSYNYNKVSMYLSDLPFTSEECEEFTSGVDSINDFLSNNVTLDQTCLLYTTPATLTCGISSSKFDDIYIPAQKFVNRPEERKELAKTIPAYTISNGRETVIKSWHGVGFNEFGRNMVFYADYGDDKTIDEALEHAKDFYQKSQLNGGTPIRIPVAIMNPDNMWLQEDGIQPPPFTCPNTTNATSNNDSFTRLSTMTVSSSAHIKSFTGTSLAAIVVLLTMMVG